MRIVVQSFEQVLNKQISTLVLSFAQKIFMLAPTKSAASIYLVLSVLDSFLRLIFSPQLFIFQTFTLTLFAVKSLEANLEIKSLAVIS